MWEDLETLHAQGKARAIGVSNFRVPDFETLLQTAKVVPAVNQVELNPYCYDHELVRFAKEKGILMSAYCPLAPIVKFSGGPVDEVVERIARKHGKSREVVIIKWGVQNGWMVVTTSSKVERLRDVGQIEGWDLTVEEVEEITRAGAQWKRRAFWNTEYA